MGTSRFLAMLACILSIFMGWSPSAAHAAEDHFDVLVKQFDNSSKREQKAMVPELVKELKRLQLTRELPTMDANTPIDTIRAEVWMQYASHILDRDEYVNAYQFLTKAMVLVEGGDNYRQKALCYSLMSYLMYGINDIAQALDYGYKSLNMNKHEEDTWHVLLRLNNMACMYSENGYPKEAMPFIEQGLKILPKVKENITVMSFYVTVSEVEAELGNFAKAEEYANKAYQIVKEDSGVQYNYYTYIQLANVKLKTNHPLQALEYLKRGLEKAKEKNNLGIEYEIYGHIGEVYLHINEVSKAIPYLEKSAKYAHENHYARMEVAVLDNLYRAYKKTNPQKAMECLEQSIKLKDYLTKRQQEIKMSQYSVAYKNQQLLEANEEQSQKQRTIIIVAVIILFILLLSLIFMWSVMRLKRRRAALEQEKNELKDRFFTNFTHEFRTPLTIIDMAAQSISEEGNGKIEDIHHHANVIRKQGRMLLSLINGILEVAKIRTNSPKDELWLRGDLVYATRIIIDSLEHQASTKSIKLDYTPHEETLEMDFIPSGLKLILQNLIANSIKYSNENSTVSITTKRNKNMAVIIVEDHGVGMTPYQKEHAYDPFFQGVDHIGKADLSTSVSLTMVKSCIEAMKGTVKLESKLNKGTVFTVELPIKSGKADVMPFTEYHTTLPIDEALVDEEQGELTDAVNGRNDGPIVLIVEDSKEVASYTGALLSDKYQVFYASNGKMGLEKANDLVPDIIISDVMMPEMNGYQLCEEVKKSPLLYYIPVILLSARITDEDQIKGLKVGADAYLTKPFNSDMLRLRVEKLLEQRQLLRKKYAQAFDEGKEDEVDWSEPDQQFLTDAYRQVELLMREHNVNVNALADKLCMSVRQLQRRIASVTDQTPIAFITHVRIKRAKALLREGRSVADVAMACGFDEPSNFARTFKKATGYTPTQYMKEKQSAKASDQQGKDA
jgi:two-component system sensor histidine kinase ChiS